jgi:hypothetical protein
MTNKCQCEVCLVSKEHQNSQKNEINKDKISAFKDNIRKIVSLSDDFDANPNSLGKLVPILPKTKLFRITLSEFDPTTGLNVECSRNIDDFDYVSLLEEFFHVSCEHDEFNNDDEAQEDSVKFFNSFEEVIEFLEKRNQNEE